MIAWITLTHLCRPVRSTFAVRETASVGIMGEPRVPPLNPSESIVLWEHYRRNGGHKWVNRIATCFIIEKLTLWTNSRSKWNVKTDDLENLGFLNEWICYCWDIDGTKLSLDIGKHCFFFIKHCWNKIGKITKLWFPEHEVPTSGNYWYPNRTVSHHSNATSSQYYSDSCPNMITEKKFCHGCRIIPVCLSGLEAHNKNSHRFSVFFFKAGTYKIVNQFFIILIIII